MPRRLPTETDPADLDPRRGQASLAQLFVEAGSSVRSYLRRHLDRPSDVEDLQQEVFLAAVKSRAPFRGEASPQAWLLGIARNKLLQFLRDDGRRRLRPGDLVSERLLEAQVERVEHEEQPEALPDRLQHCLERLPEGQRELVERFYGRGESATEIAASRGGRAGTTRMALLRIRTALKECMEAHA